MSVETAGRVSRLRMSVFVKSAAIVATAIALVAGLLVSGSLLLAQRAVQKNDRGHGPRTQLLRRAGRGGGDTLRQDR